MEQDREIQIHLAEYSVLRNELQHYSQRIDQLSGLYLTALFAVTGYLLRPDSQFNADAYYVTVKASAGLSGLYIFLTILNSILLIRIVSFFSGVLALAQYTHCIVRPRLTELVGHRVMLWDEAPELRTKQAWLPIRSIAQTLFVLVAESITVLILFSLSHTLEMSWPFFASYVLAWFLFALSIGCLVMVRRSGLTFHEPLDNASMAKDEVPPVD